jgi:hypothetical protein
MKIVVKLVSVSGTSTEKPVEVTLSGATVREVCSMGEIVTDKKDLSVNGRAATLDTHVGATDKLQVSERPKGA